MSRQLLAQTASRLRLRERGAPLGRPASMPASVDPCGPFSVIGHVCAIQGVLKRSARTPLGAMQVTLAHHADGLTAPALRRSRSGGPAAAIRAACPAACGLAAPLTCVTVQALDFSKTARPRQGMSRCTQGTRTRSMWHERHAAAELPFIAALRMGRGEGGPG